MRTIQQLALKIAVVMMMIAGSVSTAFALDLDTARTNGLVGEVDNGLLAIPPGAPADAQDLIASINNVRRTEYAKVAALNNLTLEVVGTMMFPKIYGRCPSGTWVQVHGKWTKKAQ